MRNSKIWKPSKYVFKNGKLSASRNHRVLNIGSRLIADIVASHYLEHLKLHASGLILDLGCGKVPLWHVYRDYIKMSVCADRNANPHLDLVLDLKNNLPFRGQMFDSIIMSDVLEHIPSPDNIWGELYRVLKPGGKLILNTPFYYWIHEAPHDYFRYTEFALRRFAEENGFRVINIMPIGGVMEVLTDILAKRLRSKPLIGKSLSSGIQTMCRTLLRLKAFKNYSNKTASRFPLGYFMVAVRC